MRRACYLMLLICLYLFVGLLSPARSEHGQVITYKINAVPTQMLVKRGTVIEFEGETDGNAVEQTFYIIKGNKVYTSGSFLGRWKLSMNTGDERASGCYLSLWRYRPNGGDVPLGRFHVTIAETTPFQISSPVNEESIRAAAEVKITSQVQNRPKQITLTLDNQKIITSQGASEKILWEPTNEQLGIHKLGGSVALDDGQVYELEPVQVRVVGKLRLLPFPFGNELDLSKTNGDVRLRVHIAPGVQVKQVSFLVDGIPVADRTASPFDTASWNPNSTPLGPHRLQVVGVDNAGKQIIASDYEFSVVRGQKSQQPVEKSASSLKGQPALSPEKMKSTESSPVRLRLPSEAKDFLQPITLSVQTDLGLTLKSVTYYKEGHPFVPNPEAPLTAYWDIRSERAGKYQIWAVAEDTNGHSYQTAAATINIPERIVGVAPSEPINVTDQVKTVKFTASFLSGLRPRSVDFQIDARIVASQRSEPFGEISFDASGLNTGKHRLVAFTKDETGARYVSQPVTFEVKNEPLEIAQKREEEEAKEEIVQDRKAAVFRLRKAIAGGAIGDPLSRDGAIGRVNGLAVLTINEVPAFGVPMTIEASLVPGTGQTQFLANASEDSKVSAETAVAYCRLKIAQMGYTTDWSAIDVNIAYQENSIKNSGPSAGVADAVAVMSAALQKPVDVSVAITGAIGLNGDVYPVGGVGMKAEEAFSNPAIRTLIVPASTFSEAGLSLLYLRRPGLFTSRRIIMARNMEEVLCHALIGYDETYSEAEGLIQKGIRYFLDKKDAEALRVFEKAQQLTPENVTISAWIDVVQQGIN